MLKKIIRFRNNNELLKTVVFPLKNNTFFNGIVKKLFCNITNFFDCHKFLLILNKNDTL